MRKTPRSIPESCWMNLCRNYWRYFLKRSQKQLLENSLGIISKPHPIILRIVFFKSIHKFFCELPQSFSSSCFQASRSSYGYSLRNFSEYSWGIHSRSSSKISWKCDESSFKTTVVSLRILPGVATVNDPRFVFATFGVTLEFSNVPPKILPGVSEIFFSKFPWRPFQKFHCKVLQEILWEYF